MSRLREWLLRRLHVLSTDNGLTFTREKIRRGEEKDRQRKEEDRKQNWQMVAWALTDSAYRSNVDKICSLMCKYAETGQETLLSYRFLLIAFISIVEMQAFIEYVPRPCYIADIREPINSDCWAKRYPWDSWIDGLNLVLSLSLLRYFFDIQPSVLRCLFTRNYFAINRQG